MILNELTILHLSDFHFNSANSKNSIILFNKMIKFIKDWQNKNQKTISHIFITGDVVDQADFNGYKQAQKSIKKLCKELDINFCKVFSVPGNHDVNLQHTIFNENLIRTRLEQAKFNTIDDEEDNAWNLFPDLLKRQNRYFEFIKKTGINSMEPFYIKLIDNSTIVIGLNSAIFSSFNDIRNKIFLLKKQFAEIKNKIYMMEKEPSKIFLLTHHPLDYYEENTKKHFSEYLRNNNAFIFSGHSHEQAYDKIDRNNKIAHQFWCGEFNHTRDTSFNIVDIDYEYDIFNLYVGEYKNNNWILSDNENINGIKKNLSDEEKEIWQFIKRIKHYSRIDKIKALWNYMFDSPILQFEDLWDDSGSLLILSIKQRQLKQKIKHNCSQTENILLSKWFIQFNIDLANDLFDIKRSNESYLYGNGLPKYKTFVKVLEVFPGLLDGFL